MHPVKSLPYRVRLPPLKRCHHLQHLSISKLSVYCPSWVLTPIHKVLLQRLFIGVRRLGSKFSLCCRTVYQVVKFVIFWLSLHHVYVELVSRILLLEWKHIVQIIVLWNLILVITWNLALICLSFVHKIIACLLITRNMTLFNLSFIQKVKVSFTIAGNLTLLCLFFLRKIIVCLFITRNMTLLSFPCCQKVKVSLITFKPWPWSRSWWLIPKPIIVVVSGSFDLFPLGFQLFKRIKKQFVLTRQNPKRVLRIFFKKNIWVWLCITRFDIEIIPLIFLLLSSKVKSPWWLPLVLNIPIVQISHILLAIFLWKRIVMLLRRTIIVMIAGKMRR